MFFEPNTASKCLECGAAVTPDENISEYSCHKCDFKGKTGANAHQTDRQRFAVAVAKAFKVTGECKAHPECSGLYSLGTSEKDQSVLLWYGSQAPNDKEQTLIAAYGVDAVLLHGLETPPALTKGKPWSIFDNFDDKLKGKLPMVISMKDAARKAGQKRRSKFKDIAEPVYKEVNTHPDFMNASIDKKCQEVARRVMEIDKTIVEHHPDDSEIEYRIYKKAYDSRWRKDYDKKRKAA